MFNRANNQALNLTGFQKFVVLGSGVDRIFRAIFKTEVMNILQMPNSNDVSYKSVNIEAKFPLVWASGLGCSQKVEIQGFKTLF